MILEGRCSEREQVPFKAVDGLIDDLARYWRQLPDSEANALLPRSANLLARLFPALGRVPVVANAPFGREIADALELRNRAFAALREALLRLADRHRTVLVLDDMQWVDADTVVLLTDVMRAPDPPALLLVMLSRETENERVEELMNALEVHTTPIELEPLGQKECARLARTLAPGLSETVAQRVARETRGSPFFVIEMARFLQAQEGELDDSLTLDDMLNARLARLSSDARCLLQVICPGGRAHHEDGGMRRLGHGKPRPACASWASCGRSGSSARRAGGKKTVSRPITTGSGRPCWARWTPTNGVACIVHSRWRWTARRRRRPWRVTGARRAT